MLSSGAYEWPVLVALKHAVGIYLNIGFLLQEWFRESLSKLMACSPTCELHSPHLGCGLELILAVYREVHFMATASFSSTFSNGMYNTISTLEWQVDACTWH